ncbi:unnamed protein product [Closterium sp. Naga37s-1]|nr:unnamed protein product [Closterium sp. Naga37s-1]
MNKLNAKFKKREVDITKIAKDIDEATGDLRRRYLECEDLMEGEESTALSDFLTLQGRGAAKRVRVRGVETEVFTTAERKRKGKELAEDQERERVVRRLEWDREESDEDYDKEAYHEDQAQEDDPFREEYEGENVEEIAMDQPEIQSM